MVSNDLTFRCLLMHKMVVMTTYLSLVDLRSVEFVPDVPKEGKYYIMV